jgi:hypothetical protein
MAPEPTPPKKDGSEWRPVVTLDRRALIAILVGVCILSSAIGAGFGLIAETGPAGTPGKRGPAGPEGPEGPEGPSGAAELEGLEAEVEELREEVNEGNNLENRVEELEAAVEEGFGGISPDDICREFEDLC